LYESVVLFAADFPGIRGHINRMEESLLLTRAIKKRSQRIRESAPITPNAPRTKRSVPLLAGGLALGFVVLFLFFSSKQTQETPSPKAPQAEPVQIAAIQPAISPEQTPAPLPVETKVEQSMPLETVDLPQDTALQAMPPSPRLIEESPARTTEPLPPNDATVQSTDHWYTVRLGDSLTHIAIQQFCNREAWKKIYQLNRERVPNPHKLQPGMQLQIKGIENRCLPAP
jgi:nucleoid-associated protein YgaU